MAETPAQLLERALPTRVSVRLKDARSLSGRLLGVDDHLNLLLDEVVETSGETTRKLGTVVLRGSSVVELDALGPLAGGRSR